VTTSLKGEVSRGEAAAPGVEDDDEAAAAVDFFGLPMEDGDGERDW